MTHQLSHRRPAIAIGAVLGLAIAIGSAAAAGAAGLAGRAGAPTRSLAGPIRLHSIAVGGHPYPVAIDPRRRAVWVTTPQLVRISEATQQVTARIRTIAAGAVAVDPGTGTVWTLNEANGRMAEVSEATNRVLHRFGNLGFSRAIAVDPRDHTLWVTSGNSVRQVSEATRRIMHVVNIHVGKDQVLGEITVDPGTKTVWVTAIPGDPSTSVSSVVQINEVTHRVVHTYSDGGTTSAVAAVDPARGTAWLVFGPFRESGRIWVVNIAKRKVVRTIFIDPVASQGIAIDPSTQTVIATGGVNSSDRDTLLLISERSGKVLHQFVVGLYPGQVALDQGTGNAYVSIDSRGAVVWLHE